MDGLNFVGSCSVVLDSETRETKPCHQNRRARRGEGDDETTVRVWTNRQFYALSNVDRTASILPTNNLTL